MSTADLTPEADRMGAARLDDQATARSDDDTDHPEAPAESYGVEPDGVTEEEWRRLITGAGRLLHRLIGHPDHAEHWSFTPEEIDELAPSITNITNRTHWLLALVRRGDLLILLFAVLGWAGRNRRLTEDIAKVEELHERIGITPNESEPSLEVEPTPGVVQPWDQL